MCNGTCHAPAFAPAWIQDKNSFGKLLMYSGTTIKIEFALFRGVGSGAERTIVQNAIFHAKCHDNKIMKLNILLSRNFVVMAQAPKIIYVLVRDGETTIKNKMCVLEGFGTGGREENCLKRVFLLGNARTIKS